MDARWIRFTAAHIRKGWKHKGDPCGCPLHLGFAAAGFNNHVLLTYVVLNNVHYDLTDKALEFYLRRILGEKVKVPTKGLMTLQPFQLQLDPMKREISQIRPLRRNQGKFKIRPTKKTASKVARNRHP